MKKWIINKLNKSSILIYVIIFLAFAFIVSIITLSYKAVAAECGPGLAATDLSGTCRSNPATPGALEAVSTVTPTPAPAPAPVVCAPCNCPVCPTPIIPAPSVSTNLFTVTAIWTVDLFSNGDKGFDKPWDHCIGDQNGIDCRVVIIFDTKSLPKNRTIQTVSLQLTIPFVTTGLNTTTWKVGLYEFDPRTDTGMVAFNRAGDSTNTFISGTSLLRTTGTKKLTLSKAKLDLQTIINNEGLFIINIKSNREQDTDKFTSIGNYNNPTVAPKLLVKFN